jgi:arylsulfatase A-like enzyme
MNLYAAMMRTIAVLTCAASAVPGAEAQPTAPATRPNIVLIVVESLRADHVGCYGYGRPTTPMLDLLASNGVRCADATAAANWTMPATMSLFTGRHPATHGAESIDRHLVEGLPTLAGTLAAAGYDTAGITANSCTHGKFGFSRGFGHYDDFTIIFDVGGRVLFGEDASEDRPTGPDTTRLALAWMDRRDRAKPFFLFLFYLDPHRDYKPVPPYKTMFTDPNYRGPADGRVGHDLTLSQNAAVDMAQTRALYDGEVRQTDDQIAMLLAGMQQRLGSLSNTLAVIVGDHGEEFWEHGGTAHGQTFYQEVAHVPLIWHWPGRLPAGRVLGAPVSQVDVMPTILAAADVKPLGTFDGTSLWAALRDGDDARLRTDRPLIIERTRGNRRYAAVRLGTRKAVLDEDSKRYGLFDLASDPREEHDLIDADRTGDFGPVVAALDEHLKKARALAGNEVDRLDPRLLRQLKSLGYAK